MSLDVLDQFNVPDTYENISAKALGVPEEDRVLFEQLRGDTRLTSIIDEIAFHRYLRIKVTNDAMRSGDEDREGLLDDLCKLHERHAGNPDAFREAASKKLPPAQLSLNAVRALSKLLETSGKLAEQQKKIIDGTEIKVNISGDQMIQKIFVHVIRPVVPEEYWGLIRDQARKFAPLMGSAQVLDLDNVLQ